jgi:hypothetical protein
MSNRIRAHPEVVEAARVFAAEREGDDGLQLLAQRLGVSQPRLSLLLHHPVPATPHNRELIGRLARIVGGYVGTCAARRQPIVEEAA